MSITVPIAKFNDSSRSIKSQENTVKNVAFRGKPFEIKNENIIKKVKWLGEDFNSAMQRLVSGVTALITQPFFDLHNKTTDEKTRKTSCARTLGKIIAGTATGVVIRELCIKATENFTKNRATEEELARKAKLKGKIYTPKIEFKPIEQCLLSKEALNANFRKIKKYRNAFGTFAAVGIMVFTNFLIDAPLTTYLTNKFNNMFGVKDSKKSGIKADKGGKQ